MTEWLDAASSDPATLQWMVGSPPPPDKLIQFADGSAFRFPRTRWSYSNVRRLVPTSAVPRGAAIVMLPRAERTDLDAVTFTPTGQTGLMTWEQSLAANFTDGILVLHRGRVVYERYFGVLDAATPHLAFSVTKSFVATIAGILAAEGALDDRATVATYLPELKHGGFADATIAQLLDMTTGLKYSEDYVDDKAGIWALARAGNFRPRPKDYQGPGSFYDYLQTIPRDYEHGQRFAYKTANTDVLGWVLRRVTGKTTSALMFDYLWSKLGVEQDAYFTIDTTGVEFAGAGLNLALRDLVRFGEMMRLGGHYNGHQIVPADVVDDIRAGGNREQFAGAGYTQLPGWSYRRMWWVSHNDHGAFAARGIHGQAIYVDPAAEMVVARFASHPQGANVHLDPTSLPAYHALAKHLLKAPA
jgi:CubicO group peptidase (beta-lactamase class C family)